MKYNLSNKVVASLGESESQSPKRSLDLDNIITPELALLSPIRSEIAPRGRSRDSALFAYSERLRDSYKRNEGGLREGMVLLGDAFRSGQSISITCFCRAGQKCHADVVKLAIEKVAKAIDAKELQQTGSVRTQDLNFRPSNPRTERAINDILSISEYDRILSKLDKTDGRNRSEHASYLNVKSQFLRDSYERGGTVQNGILVVPKEHPDPKSPLQISSLEYGVKRLEQLVGPEKAREIAPQIVEYGKTIAGSNSDRDTDVMVFRWIYEALEGKQQLTYQGRELTTPETTPERLDRVMSEVSELANEMAKLEPSDREIMFEDLVETNSLSIANPLVDEELHGFTEYTLAEQEFEIAYPTTGFERTELASSNLTLLATELSAEELQHWSAVKFPALDDALEIGIPPSTIIKLFKAKPDRLNETNSKGKELSYEDLRFASAYLEHQLTQPETRLRHFNERYREYAQKLDRCQSREEVIEASSRIRIENTSVGLERLENTQKRDENLPALTQKEMQMLFTEQSPRHYTSEMIVAKLNYGGDRETAKARTEALKRGEIAPSPEARKLIESLESRMERKYLNDSLSATKHFFQSLRTPNEELRLENSFDHSELYRKLPPAERDFVYQKATAQKQRMETLISNSDHSLHPHTYHATDSARHKHPSKSDFDLEELRSAIKSELVDASRSILDKQAIAERTSAILVDRLSSSGVDIADQTATQSLSRELVEIVVRTRVPFNSIVHR